MQRILFLILGWLLTVIQVAECQSCPTLVPGLHMLVSNTTSSMGDAPVEVSCDATYKLDIDKPVKFLVCNASGMWNDTLGACVMIECNAPPDLPTAVTFPPENLTYGSKVVYECHSGYSAWGNYNKYSFTATCGTSYDAEVTWLKTGTTKSYLPKCYVVPRSAGCYNMSCIAYVVAPSTTHGTGVDICLEFCQNSLSRFTALNNGTCYCGDLDPACEEHGAPSCDSYCQNHTPGAPSSPVPIFCGGAEDLASVYYTFEGCQEGVDTSNASSEEILHGHGEVTCRERCRASDSSYASLTNNTCHCFNLSDLAGSSFISGKCDEALGHRTIFDIGKYARHVDTCSDLFSQGIMTPGMYYLGDPEIRKHCYFMDGTVCDEGWVGFSGYCYRANNNATMDFDNAIQFCDELGANVVSVLSSEEADFLKVYRTTYCDEIFADKEQPHWWLGMRDESDSSMFMWRDGNMMRYSNFFPGMPEALERQCVVEHYDNLQWWDKVCSESYNVMCKKRASWSYCTSLSPDPPAAEYIKTDVNMSLTYCMEVCKGQQTIYVLVQNASCHCTNTPATGTPLSKTDCSTPCPGRQFQQCGGDSNTYTYVNVSGSVNARSCAELQLIGLDQGDYLAEPDDSTFVVEQCPVPSCPYSWLSVGTQCYKTHLATVSAADSFARCAQDNAYLVSMETTQETTALLGIMHEIGMYRSLSKFRIGLKALSMQDAKYRWASGKQVDSVPWMAEHPRMNMPEVLLASTTSPATFLTEPIDRRVFMCEKGLDYLGCYRSVMPYTTASISGYHQMTVQLCVERCRADNHIYAYLTNYACYCWSALTDAQPGESCKVSCSGQLNQVCGTSNGAMAVYNVSDYPSFANTCSDLAEAGIFLSGDYIVNNVETHCDLLDDVSCGDPEWFSDNGNCYKHLRTPPSPSWAEACRARNATQVSLYSQAEWDILTYYLKRIYVPHTARVFSGISHGGYKLDVFIGQDGLLVDPGLIGSGLLMTKDLYYSDGYISFRINQDVNLPHDGGVICKKEKYLIGCFHKPNHITPILENYTSVELTLCRQLCAAAGHDMTLIGKGYCAGVSTDEAALFVAAPAVSCDEPCLIHKDQRCGDGTVVWAHDTFGTDMSYAPSCTSLYKAGIFYNFTYLLEDPIPGNQTHENCGFSDNTTCPPNTIGKDGECFKFKKDTVNFVEAARNCIQEDSYLFNPVSNGVNDFVTDFIQRSGLLENSSYWHAGIVPKLYNYSYVASNGQFIRTDFSNGINKPRVFDLSSHARAPAYDVETGVWYDSGDEKLPYICQKNEAYLGCHTIHTPAGASFESDRNSMTMCIQWCHGQDMLFAATRHRTCSCYNASYTMTPAYGNCNFLCEGALSQPCGTGIIFGSTEHFSVMEIPGDVDLASSCEELFIFGAVQAGWFYIQRNGLARERVQCLMHEGPYQAVLESNITGKWASSAMADFPWTHSRFDFPGIRAWKPETVAASETLRYKLDGPRLITGIITAGVRSAEEFSYVTSYGMEYYEDITRQWDIHYENGSEEMHPECSDVTGVCLQFFSQPITTSWFKLRPMSWHGSIALQMMPIGESVFQFNYAEKYLGCFLDPDNGGVSTGVTGDLGACIDRCQQDNYPFASIDQTDECLCSSHGVEKGLVQDSDCPTQSAYRTGASGRRAFYRTYDPVCLASDLPGLQNGTMSNVAFPYQHGVYTHATQAYYTCDEGFEYLDGSAYQVSVCQQNNQWSNLTKTCSIKHCQNMPPIANGEVVYTSNQYLGRANVTCDAGTYAENEERVMEVICESNAQWTIIPTCSVHNRNNVAGCFRRTKDTVRNQTDILGELRCRNKLQCVAKCNTNFYCKGANYIPYSPSREPGTCKLFESKATHIELLFELGSEYFEL